MGRYTIIETHPDSGQSRDNRNQPSCHPAQSVSSASSHGQSFSSNSRRPSAAQRRKIVAHGVSHRKQVATAPVQTAASPKSSFRNADFKRQESAPSDVPSPLICGDAAKFYAIKLISDSIFQLRIVRPEFGKHLLDPFRVGDSRQ